MELNSELQNQCIRVINKILNDDEVYKSFSATYGNIVLLLLFVNYETDDIYGLDYNLKKAERYFEKHYSAVGYEKMVVSFFREMVLANFSDKKNMVKKYKNKFSHLLSNDKEFALAYKTTGIFIDFECWLDSQIIGRPFLEVLKEKAEKSEAR
ncbi:MAG: hypothetical protein HYU69_13955 [Bacteroidetes bacterium]|nr:hypothetical protein [Bacteroidota bacterium]